MYRLELVRGLKGQETLLGYLDSRCIDPDEGDMDTVRVVGPDDENESPRASGSVLFDPINGRLLATASSQCSGPDCLYAAQWWVFSVSGFTTLLDVLQTFTPTASELGFRVPYMPEGMGGADYFDTYYGDLGPSISPRPSRSVADTQRPALAPRPATT